MLVVGIGVLLINDRVILVIEVSILRAHLETFEVFRVLSDLCELFESCVITGSSDFVNYQICYLIFYYKSTVLCQTKSK